DVRGRRSDRRASGSRESAAGRDHDAPAERRGAGLTLREGLSAVARAGRRAHANGRTGLARRGRDGRLMAATSATKLALARGVGAISRMRGRGGTSAPGKWLVRLAPDAIHDLGARLRLGSVLISATNGKTTTAAMAARIFERAGVALVHNDAGANMAGGIASALLTAAGRR